MLVINIPPLWQNVSHFIGVGQRFDSAISISPSYVACTIDCYFFKPYQISLLNTLIVVIKYI